METGCTRRPVTDLLASRAENTTKSIDKATDDRRSSKPYHNSKVINNNIIINIINNNSIVVSGCIIYNIIICYQTICNMICTTIALL